MPRRKRHEEEEHENHERWLVTYADMVTLLMVLFIVMFAMSTVDAKKFNALKSGLAAGFGQSTSVLDGSSSILSEPGLAVHAPVAPQSVETPPEIEEITTSAVTKAMAEQQQRAYAEAAGEADRLGLIARRIKKAMREAGLGRDITTRIDGKGLTISMVSRHVVFEANLATLTERGRRIVDVMAPVLASTEDTLRIEGHTNQAPGRPRYYPSDWDLASARAITVLRRLSEDRGLREDRLSAVGFGHIRPLIDPAAPRSQQLNKRVDIVVVSRLAAGGEALLDRVAHDRATAAAERTAANGTAAKQTASRTSTTREEH